MLIKAGTVYIPENKVDITASGTVILYQGEMGQDTLNKLKVNNGGLDPVDKTPYTYSTTKNLQQYELMGFLENGNKVSYQVPSPERGGLGRGLFPQANAISTNLINRFPVTKGDSIGIILDPTTNSPIQSTGTGVDIVNTNINLKVYLDNSSSGSISGTGNILKNQLSHVINPVGSCNSILKNGQSKGDGIYKIDLNGTGSIEVYCDMTTQGGGWTLVGKWDRDWTIGYDSAMPNGAFQNDINISDLTFINKVGTNQSATLKLENFISNGAKYLMHVGLDQGDKSYKELFFSDIYQSVIDNPGNIFKSSLDGTSGTCVSGMSNIRKDRWYDSSFVQLGDGDIDGNFNPNRVDGGVGTAMFTNYSREGAVYASHNNGCGGHLAPYVQWGFYGDNGSRQSYGCNGLKVGTACNIVNSSGYKPIHRFNLMFIR